MPRIGGMLTDADGVQITRVPVETTIAASAARTTDFTSVDQTNDHGRGVAVVVDITAVTATPVITVRIQGKDPGSEKYFNLLASAATIGTVATFVYVVYPGVASAAQGITESIGFVLPRTWRVFMDHGDADSATYTVGAIELL